MTLNVFRKYLYAFSFYILSTTNSKHAKMNLADVIFMFGKNNVYILKQAIIRDEITIMRIGARVKIVGTYW